MNYNKRIQQTLLPMFVEIHKICIENNITYYMVGGTMLGAVRHKGFIPWDDDIDIAMPRKDYNKFISIANEMLPSYLKVRHLTNEDDYMFLIAKMHNLETTLIEEARRNYGSYGGIFIDIFPIDKAPNTLMKRKVTFFIINNIKKLVNCHYSATDFTDKQLKSFFKLVIKYFTSKKILIYLLDYFTTIYDSKNTEYIANYYGRWLEKETMKQSIFGTPTLYEFEGREFYGVEKYDEYLQNLYGDYMELPPPEMRTSGHNIHYIKFDESYKR